MPEIKFEFWDRRSNYEIQVILDADWHAFNDIYVYHLEDRAKSIYFSKWEHISRVYFRSELATPAPKHLVFAWQYRNSDILKDPWE